jgi:hypothetical protein
MHTKNEESAWQKKHSRETMGQEHPLIMKSLSPKEKTARIKQLLKTSKGDGSIAVTLNREGIECSRGDVFYVRNGTRAPDNQGCFEETSFVGES